MTTRLWILLGVAAIVIYVVFFVDRKGYRQKAEAWREQEAILWAERSMRNTVLCLNGEQTEMFEIGECEEDWSMKNRVGHYRRLLEKVSPPLYE